MTTLLVLYRRPEGGADALADVRAPLRDGAPAARRPDAGPARRPASSGCRGALGGETDLALVTAMDFDDRAALDAGLASDPMRAAGRILREIAPGLATFLVRRGRARPGWAA